MKNFINNTTFFEWDPATYNSYFKKIKGAEEITIPKLNEMAYEQVEVASVPFVSFVGNKGTKDEAVNYSFVLRGYVRHWLGNVWGEFDRVKLVDLVSPTMASNVRQAAGYPNTQLRRLSGGIQSSDAFRGSTTIVASPRPRVGKTLLARLLTDFHLHEGRSVATYDLMPASGRWRSSYPKKTTRHYS